MSWKHDIVFELFQIGDNHPKNIDVTQYNQNTFQSNNKTLKV